MFAKSGLNIDAAVVFEPSSTFFARSTLYLGHVVAGYNQQSQFTKLSDKDNGVHPNTCPRLGPILPHLS